MPRVRFNGQARSWNQKPGEGTDIISLEATLTRDQAGALREIGASVSVDLRSQQGTLGYDEEPDAQGELLKLRTTFADLGNLAAEAVLAGLRLAEMKASANIGYTYPFPDEEGERVPTESDVTDAAEVEAEARAALAGFLTEMGFLPTDPVPVDEAEIEEPIPGGEGVNAEPEPVGALGV